MDTSARYTAFISYSARDRILGKRFQTALERYRVPRPLRGRTSGFGRIGADIGPTFRDRTDLAAHESLSDALTEALAASRFLVVLCSPAAAASRWVNEEIREFYRLGRRDRVIPVLVDGVPDAYSAAVRPTGAFPPALMEGLDAEAEPFAPDLRQPHPSGYGDGFELALLKVVARILDVPLAELTQRHMEAERRKRRLTMAVAAAMAVLAVGASLGGWYSWQQTRLANDRLSETIDVAARQVDVARGFRSRYGVPRAVVEELYSGAEQDFEAIVARAGDTPQLRLDRARLALSLADFAEVIERRDTRDFYLGQAQTAISALDAPGRPWSVRLGLLDDVPADDVRRNRLELLHRRADAALRDRAIDVALNQSEQALAQARAASTETPGPGWQRAVAQALCSHGNRLYRAGRDVPALAVLQDCVTAWRRLEQSPGTTQDRAGLMRALSQEATLRRALDDRETSLARQAEAAALAATLAASDLDNTVLGSNLFVALLWHADALQAAGRDPSEQLTALNEAEDFATRLAASDPARMDWQRNLAIVLERRATLEAQLICAAPLESRRELLAESDARIGRAIALHEARVARDRDDPLALRDLSVVLNARAVVLADHAGLAPDGPEAALAQAQELLERSVDIGAARVDATDGLDRIARHDLAETRLKLAQIAALRRLSGDFSQVQFDLAEQALRKLLAEPDALPAWQYELAILKVRQAQDLARLDKLAGAGDALQEARDIAARLSADHPDNPQYSMLARELVSFDPTGHHAGLPGC